MLRLLDDPHGIRWSIPVNPSAVGFTRKRVVAQLLFWGVPVDEDTALTLEILVGELVSNAVRHAGGGAVQLGLAARHGTAMVVVSDTSVDVPREQTTDGEAESGRGLVLIESLADTWGYELRPTGKDVWLTLSLPCSEPELPCDSGGRCAGAPVVGPQGLDCGAQPRAAHTAGRPMSARRLRFAS